MLIVYIKGFKPNSVGRENGEILEEQYFKLYFPAIVFFMDVDSFLKLLIFVVV